MITREQLLARFRARFDREADAYRAPGRVNLIGGHSDYNDGLVLPTTTALFTYVAVAPRSDRRVRVYSGNFDEEVAFELDDIIRGEGNHWSNYVKGLAQVLLRAEKIATGFDLLVEGELPMGGGLSSSASLETAIAYALLCSSGQGIECREMALLCQKAEADFVGARCGVMDQYAISCGSKGCATMLDCRTIEHHSIPLPDAFEVLVVDTGVKHQLADSGFNDRREECETAAALLSKRLGNVTALRDVNREDLESCRSMLGDTLYRRSRHVVSEIARVRDAADALTTGDIATLGKLINASHASLRDDHEVSCPEMEALIGILAACEGVHGARLTGGGFGGCAIAVVEPTRLEAVKERAAREYGELLGETPWMHVIEASDSVGRFA